MAGDYVPPKCTKSIQSLLVLWSLILVAVTIRYYDLKHLTKLLLERPRRVNIVHKINEEIGGKLNNRKKKKKKKKDESLINRADNQCVCA